MRRVRRREERGHLDHGWLDTYHTFSFGSYDDPEHRGFRSLRVINEDYVAPGEGFGRHEHRDMEILTVVLEGAVEHRDSLGYGSVLGPGQVQRMTAGTGIEHSEFNPSAEERLHLYQIWLYPDRRGHAPSYEQREVPPMDAASPLTLIAAREGAVVRINQDARVYLGRLAAGQVARQTLGEGRHAWVQVLRGSVAVDGVALEAGDGLSISEEAGVSLAAGREAEVLVFYLA